MSFFETYIKGPLYGKVYTETWEDIADGGPKCSQELTIQFRVVVAFVMMCFQLGVLAFALNQVHKKYGKPKGSTTMIKPHLLEIIFGWFSLVIFGLQIWYKLSAGKGIFLLNPCHVVLLLEAYVLLMEKTESTQVMYANMVSLLFSPVCGILYAVDIGLEGPYEIEVYWIEHYVSAVVNPLVLSLSGRYHDKKFFHPYFRLIGFAFFSLYHRIILLPLALLTWANLDQTLCHAETDPFYPMFGDWYYLMADFYIPIASNICGYSYLIVCEVVAWLKKSTVEKANHHYQNGVSKKEIKKE